MEINKIYNEDCLTTMARMPNNFVDLTVTSPPYDKLRTYDKKSGFKWNFEVFKPIAKELYRVTKEGGVVVWVVGDATIKGSETGSSFRQALYFKEECGFNLHDTMIYEKTGAGAVGSNYCYWQNFEYMFILVKGKLQTFNPICDRLNVVQGNRTAPLARGKEGTVTSERRNIYTLPYGRRFNTWKITPQKQKGHPAPFPEKLAEDHILSWSNEGDLAYDPMAGSGTTFKMAKKNNRNCIVSEISEEYCKIIEERLKEV